MARGFRRPLGGLGEIRRPCRRVGVYSGGSRVFKICSQLVSSGQKALSVGWDGLGDPRGGPEGVRWPSRWAGRGHKALSKGQEALPVGWGGREAMP